MSLEISYHGQEVSNLTVTKFAFWNHGRDPIRQEDIPTAAPILIKTKGGAKILDAKVIQFTTAENKFAINADADACGIGFEYLGEKDGAIVQLLHTGRSSQDIEVVGTVIGAGKPVWVRESWVVRMSRASEFLRNIPTLRSQSRVNLAPAVAITGGLVMVAVALIDWVYPEFLAARPSQSEAGQVSGVLGAMGVLYLILGFGLLRSRVPKGLRKFYESF
jgi:hypothetical protein